MKELLFSYNWNKKLDCNSFSTVRLENPKKYVLLDEFKVILQTKGNGPNIEKGIARLQVIHTFNLFKVTPAICFLDANLNVFEFQKLVLAMYKNKNIDFKTHNLSFLVFQYLRINEAEKKEARQLEAQI